MTTPDLGLAHWFTQRARRTPERRAMTFEGETWTYAQMLVRIEALAGRLLHLGVGRGNRVAFLGTNQPAFLETMFAAARINAIFMPLNFRLTGPEGSPPSSPMPAPKCSLSTPRRDRRSKACARAWGMYAASSRCSARTDGSCWTATAGHSLRTSAPIPTTSLC